MHAHWRAGMGTWLPTFADYLLLELVPEVHVTPPQEHVFTLRIR